MMEEPPASPANSQTGEVDNKALFPHTIISSPESIFTLEHKRIIQEENKAIYCLRFEPDDAKTLAIGYSDGTIGVIKVSNGFKTNTLGAGIPQEERRPIGCLRYILSS